MKIRIFVTKKLGVLDPEAKTVLNTLQTLNFSNVRALNKGSYFDIDVDIQQDQVKEFVDSVCKKLLVNGVIETYFFEILS